MSLTIEQARDAILSRFKTVWDADAESAGLPIVWSDAKGDPPETGHWARVTVRHVTAGQATLSGETGNRRFRREGIVTAQVFTQFGTGAAKSDRLAKVVMGAFEGYAAPGGVWFRNVRLVEVGQSGNFYQVNVLADFEYDEVR